MARGSNTGQHGKSGQSPKDRGNAGCAFERGKILTGRKQQQPTNKVIGEGEERGEKLYQRKKERGNRMSKPPLTEEKT